MYILYKINSFTLNILRKDPKRNYKKNRIILFYLKVLINTIKNKKRYKHRKCEIAYITNTKELYFTKNKIYIKYLDEKIKNNYLFLIENKIINDLKFEGEYFNQPFYENPLVKPYKSEFLLEQALDSFNDRLIALKLELSNEYFFKIYKTLLKLNLPDSDKSFLKKIFSIEPRQPIYISFVHGDLWKGNIILNQKDVIVFDWDDFGIKSITYDLFYYYYQEYSNDFQEFHHEFNQVRKTILPLFIKIFKKHNLKIEEKNYLDYYKVFILERMLKRYEK